MRHPAEFISHCNDLIAPWHLCIWAKYELERFLSQEYLDMKEQADDFVQSNKSYLIVCLDYWDR